jgi:hypothetical protein
MMMQRVRVSFPEILNRRQNGISREFQTFNLLSGSVDWKPTTSKANSRLSPDPPIVPEEKIKEIMERENVWLSDPVEGFVSGRIVDIGEDGATVEPTERGKKSVVARYANTKSKISDRTSGIQSCILSHTHTHASRCGYSAIRVEGWVHE